MFGCTLCPCLTSFSQWNWDMQTTTNFSLARHFTSHSVNNAFSYGFLPEKTDILFSQNHVAAATIIMFRCLHFVALLPSYDAVYKLPAQERLMFDRKTIAHSLKDVYSFLMCFKWTNKRLCKTNKQKRTEIDTWHIHKKIQKKPFGLLNLPPKWDSWFPDNFRSAFFCYTNDQSKKFLNSIFPESLLAISRWPKSPRTLGTRLDDSQPRITADRPSNWLNVTWWEWVFTNIWMGLC